MYTLLLAIIYLAFISLGLPDSLLGASWPTIYLEMEVPISYMGIITMIISGCTILSSLCSNFLNRKLGTKYVAIISVFLTAFALFGFSFSIYFWMLIIFAIPYGLGAGAIDAALNNYVALHYKAKHMSWLHCFWGVGAIVSPFIMSYSLINFNWSFGYRIVGIIQLVIAFIMLISIPLWKINSKKDEEIKQNNIGLFKVLKIKGVVLLLIGFFAYCALEATAMSWASTYFVEVKGVIEERAALFASLFYIGMTFSRFLSGFFSDKLGDRKMILIGIIVALIGIIFLFIPSSYIFAIVGFVVLGIGCGPIYPSIIHSTPFNFGKENSGSIIGVQMASAYIGSTFMSPLFGYLAKIIGFDFMAIYLLIFLVLSFSMLELTFYLTKNTHLNNSK